MRIVVDVHETKSGIAELLAELGASVERASLPAGDYAVGADTIIERKRVLDLHGAVLKGRLWPQLGKLRAACAFPYLLLEGTDIDRGPLHPNAIRGTCLAVIDQGISLLRSDHQRDSAAGFIVSRSAANASRPHPIVPLTHSGQRLSREEPQRKHCSRPCPASVPSASERSRKRSTSHSTSPRRSRRPPFIRSRAPARRPRHGLRNAKFRPLDLDQGEPLARPFGAVNTELAGLRTSGSAGCWQSRVRRRPVPLLLRSRGPQG